MEDFFPRLHKILNKSGKKKHIFYWATFSKPISVKTQWLSAPAANLKRCGPLFLRHQATIPARNDAASWRIWDATSCCLHCSIFLMWWNYHNCVRSLLALRYHYLLGVQSEDGRTAKIAGRLSSGMRDMTSRTTSISIDKLVCTTELKCSIVMLPARNCHKLGAHPHLQVPTCTKPKYCNNIS